MPGTIRTSIIITGSTKVWTTQPEWSVTGSLPPSTDFPSLLRGASQGFLLEKYKSANLASAVGLNYAPRDKSHFNDPHRTVNTINYLSRSRKPGVHQRWLPTESGQHRISFCLWHQIHTDCKANMYSNILFFISLAINHFPQAGFGELRSYPN